MDLPKNPNTVNDSDGVATVAVSPTGAPVIPPTAVPWLVGLVGLATVATQTLPPHTIAFKVASIVVGLGSIFGLASPGLRTAK